MKLFITIILGCLGGIIINSNSSKALFITTQNKLIQDTTINWKGINCVLITMQSSQLSFFLEDTIQKFKTFQKLHQSVSKKNKKLLFAMNGGMYLPAQDNEPQGLYIENGKTRKDLDTITSYRPIKTNFYLHPNGVFYIKKDGSAHVKSNTAFQKKYLSSTYTDIQYATQSGPMLVNEGKIHPAFTANSPNTHIRNAVGVLPNGDLCFVLSEEEICFYDLASLFKDYLKCKDALYLDGYVSKLYYPKLEKYNNLNCGDFGVIIGVVE